VPVVVVMGVTGAGKTTVGRLLARALGVPFLDADDYHSPAAIEKMRAGVPLDDTDRAPWLARLNRTLRAHPDGAVLAASALTTGARAALGAGVPGLRYVLLTGDPAVIGHRIGARRGHFAGPALLPSQLALLEPPADAVVVDVDAPPETVARRALRGLGLTPPASGNA